MSIAPILSQSCAAQIPTAERWVARAEQARRIARLLPPADADIAEAYAIECEVEALRCVSAPYRRDVLAA
jgi:hypothetical protein